MEEPRGGISQEMLCLLEPDAEVWAVTELHSVAEV